MQYLGSFGSYVHSPSVVCSTTSPASFNTTDGGLESRDGKIGGVCDGPDKLTADNMGDACGGIFDDIGFLKKKCVLVNIEIE